jgi:hypothetical protein
LYCGYIHAPIRQVVIGGLHHFFFGGRGLWPHRPCLPLTACVWRVHLDLDLRVYDAAYVFAALLYCHCRLFFDFIGQ